MWCNIKRLLAYDTYTYKSLWALPLLCLLKELIDEWTKPNCSRSRFGFYVNGQVNDLERSESRMICRFGLYFVYHNSRRYYYSYQSMVHQCIVSKGISFIERDAILHSQYFLIVSVRDTLWLINYFFLYLKISIYDLLSLKIFIKHVFV